MESGASPNPHDSAEELSGYLMTRDKALRQELRFRDQSHAVKPPYAIKGTVRGRKPLTRLYTGHAFVPGNYAKLAALQITAVRMT